MQATTRASRSVQLEAIYEVILSRILLINSWSPFISHEILGSRYDAVSRHTCTGIEKVIAAGGVKRVAYIRACVSATR